MAQTKVSQLNALAATPATNDELYLIDVSEAAEADKSKKIDISYLMQAITLITIENDITFANGKKINVDEIRATDAGGLNLFDDGGSGIVINDGGQVNIANLTGVMASGGIGGWTVITNYLYSLENGTPTSSPSDGIVLDSVLNAIRIYENTEKRIEMGYLAAGIYGIVGYAANGTTKIFEISDTQQKIAGWNFTDTILTSANITIDSGNDRIVVNGITIDGANNRIQSDNYVSGILGAGFILEPDLLEVGNIRARGMIRTAVFQKDIVSIVGGNLMVLPGDVLDIDMTAADNSTLTIEGNETFAVNDILWIKDDTYEEWLQVTNIGSAPTYTVTRDKGSDYGANANPAWKKGASVSHYGNTTSGGTVYMTASETNAPYIQVNTHVGAPWNAQITRLRMGNLKGFLGEGSEVYGIAIGEATKYLKYDPTGGLQIKGTIIITGGSGIASLSDAGGLATANDVDFDTEVTGAEKPANNATVGADWSSNLSNRPGELTDGRVSTGLDSNGVLITKAIPASNVAPSGAGLYLGADYLGYYDSSNWKTYMDSSGNFYLGGSSGKLQWNGAALSIEGSIIITGGSGIASLTDAGGLATKSSVDLATGEVTNKSLANVDSAADTKLGGIATGADVTGSNQAASIAGQGALATQSSVDLSTGEVTNKTADNIAETGAKKWAGETGADITGGHTAADTALVNGLAASRVSGWAHASDTTKIDGGDMYVGSEILIGGATQGAKFSLVNAAFGAAGIQLVRVNDGGWKTKAYFGDGANEFFKYIDGSGVSISTAQASAITLKAGADITLEADDSNPGKIIFAGTSYTTEFGPNQGTGGAITMTPGTLDVVGLAFGHVSGALRQFVVYTGDDGHYLETYKARGVNDDYYMAMTDADSSTIQGGSYIRARYFKTGGGVTDYEGYLAARSSFEKIWNESKGDFLPVSTGAYDLGTINFKWKDIHLSGDVKVATDVEVGGNIIFDTNDYISYSGNEYQFNIASSDVLQLNATDMISRVNFIPESDSASTLGTSSKYWSAVYADTHYIDAQFYLDISADNTYISFDATDHIVYIRNTNSYNFVLGNITHLTLNNTNLIAKVHVIPETDSMYTLGGGGLCWSNIYGDVGVTSCSDPKYKKYVKESPFGLNLIEKLDIVQWEWNKTEGKTLEHKWHGILAPDVLGVLKELGYSHDDFGGINLEDILDDDGNKIGENWGFRYEQLIGPMVNAIKELSAEIETLKKLQPTN